MIKLDCITHICICGSQMWILDWVMFDEYEISAYSLNMTCRLCGATAITPTPIDGPEDNMALS